MVVFTFGTANFSVKGNEGGSAQKRVLNSDLEKVKRVRLQLVSNNLDSVYIIEKFLQEKKIDAINNENPELLANVNFDLGILYFNSENYIKAIPSLQSAIENLSDLTYSDSLILYNSLTIAFTEIKAFNSAVRYVSTLEYLINKNQKEYNRITNNIVSLDGLYYNLGMFDDAIRVFRDKSAKGENLIRSDPYRYSVDVFDLGRYFSGNNQPDSAIHYYQLSRSIVESSNFENGDYFLGLIKGNTGQALIKQRKYEEAIPLLKEDYVASLRSKDYVNSAKNLNILAYCELKTGDIDNALRHLKAVKDLVATNDPDNIKYVNTLYLSQAFGAIEQYDSAYWYAKKHIQLTDSLAANRNIEKSAQLAVSVELRHREQIMQSALLSMHQQKKIAEKNRQAFNLTLVGTVLLAISFITVLILLRNQSVQKNKLKVLIVTNENKTQELEKSLHEKEYLLKEIHHRVKNNLQIVSGILQLQAIHSKNKEIKHIMNESQNRIKSMALIHQMLYQNEDIRYIPFKQYLEKLSSQVMSALMVDSNRVQVNIIINEIYLDVETAIPLGLIVNELLSNAIKYAYPKEESGQIDIWLKNEDKNQYSLVVSDDGVGFPEGIDIKSTNTLGLQLVTMLSKQLKSELTYKGTNGTEISLKFNIQNKN
ncbi:MAG: two-component sensor histidine kinase/tetratricopeptide (TPR) repeat protein [Salibacteraceae bacterium]|jgi:two-component sensor histidine kinase/tetratricopeptide (TPR) repeat protein